MHLIARHTQNSWIVASCYATVAASCGAPAVLAPQVLAACGAMVLTYLGARYLLTGLTSAVGPMAIAGIAAAILAVSQFTVHEQVWPVDLNPLLY